LGYNALNDFFPTMRLQANESCEDWQCVKRQKEYKAYLETNPPVQEVEVEESSEIVHEEDWGISVVEETTECSSSAGDTASLAANLPQGMRLAYTIPERNMHEENTGAPVESEDVSLEELMSKMKSI